MNRKALRISRATLLGFWVLGAAGMDRGYGIAAETRAETAPAPAVETIRVAAAQPRRRSIDWRTKDPAEVLDRVDRSLRELERIIHDAGAARCDALAFPEDTLGLLDWEAANPDRLEAVLPAAVRRMLERLGRAAASHRMYLVLCNDVLESDGSLRNTAFLLGRDGKEIGRYHKVNLPIHEQNKQPGTGFPVFDTPDLGGVGMAICYDMVFPEATRCLALAGAGLIFNPTLGGAAIGDQDISRAAFRTRAVENFVYLVVAKRGSGSLIVSPQGKVLAEADGPDSLAIADVDPFGGRQGGDAMNHQRDMRARLFRERNPAAYALLTEPDPPVLAKVPESISVEEAVDISARALTTGEEMFREAEDLLRRGRTAEAIAAFERLRGDFRQTWIDRVSRERLANLASTDEGGHPVAPSGPGGEDALGERERERRIGARSAPAPLEGAAAGPDDDAAEPPEIPFGYDAFLEWHRWAHLRIGVRAYMKSTFDRTGGNHFADSGHYIRQVSLDRSVVLDEAGPGILWFVRHNHWHGSPWRYRVDGRETIVRESSTADPTRPVAGSVFLPEELFPKGLTFTWSETRGADLSWVPVPFEKSLELSYSRARYGTGYFIFWKLPKGIEHLSRPLESWSERSVPPREVLDLLARSGTDIAPRGETTQETNGALSLRPYETALLARLEGPASLRRLAFRVPAESADALAASRLRVWWDGRAHPSIDAPLGLFFGTASLLRDPGQEWIVRSFPMTVRFEEDGSFLFATYFPMPFLASARIELSESSGRAVEGIEWSARREPYTGPANHVGLFHATYRDFPRPEPGEDLVLLDTRDTEGGGAWCGHFVGTTYLFTKTATLNTLEGDPRFYFDDSNSPQCQGTGSEEWGGGGDYWGGRTMTLPFAGHPVGKPPAETTGDLDRIHSAYRFLLSDLMPFGRRARITLEHGGENRSREHYETVTYWYGVDRPSLVLTDVLDVGDEASEKEHAYRSPEASPPVELASRFELGPDHVPVREGRGRREVFPPVTDDGRRTRGFTEFTFEIQPRNLGVLLRRRLDLAYPNQRARVLVSDDVEPPSWKDAGTWYTAGGNRVVFGDPLALPEKERHGHPELAPAATIVEISNRRWREDEFLLPRSATEGRRRIRVRLEFEAPGLPLVPGGEPLEEAWTEFRYWCYAVLMPSVRDPHD